MLRSIFEFFLCCSPFTEINRLKIQISSMTRSIEDLQKDVKRLYNQTNGTQALENLLEKRVSSFQNQVERLGLDVRNHQKSLCARSLESDQNFKKLEDEIGRLRKYVSNKMAKPKRDLCTCPRERCRERVLNALRTPRDSDGRFARGKPEAKKAGESSQDGA